MWSTRTTGWGLDEDGAVPLDRRTARGRRPGERDVGAGPAGTRRGRGAARTGGPDRRRAGGRRGRGGRRGWFCAGPPSGRSGRAVAGVARRATGPAAQPARGGRCPERDGDRRRRGAGPAGGGRRDPAVRTGAAGDGPRTEYAAAGPDRPGPPTARGLHRRTGVRWGLDLVLGGRGPAPGAAPGPRRARPPRSARPPPGPAIRERAGELTIQRSSTERGRRAQARRTREPNPLRHRRSRGEGAPAYGAASLRRRGRRAGMPDRCRAQRLLARARGGRGLPHRVPRARCSGGDRAASRPAAPRPPTRAWWSRWPTSTRCS